MVDNHHMGKLLEEAAQEDQTLVQGVLHLALEVHHLVVDLGPLEVEQPDLKVEHLALEEEHLDPEVEHLVVKEGEALIPKLATVHQEVPKMDPLEMDMKVSELLDLVVKDHLLTHSVQTLVMVPLLDQIPKEGLMAHLLVLEDLGIPTLTKEDLEVQTLQTAVMELLEVVLVMTALGLVLTQGMQETYI